jgi:cell division protein FtsB
MLRQQTQTVLKPRRIGPGGAVRWIVLGAVILFGGLALAGCNQAPAQDASTEELAQQQEENADLQKQIEELEDEQDKQEQGTPAPKEAASKQAVPAAGPNADDAVKAAAAYYDNSAAGDWDATYAQLSSNSTAYYTPEDWAAANNALGTGTFEVTYAEETEPNVFYAEVLVNGTARDTYWIYDGGQYYHDLTTEEYAMFDDALAGGSATASASASASAAPSTDSAGAGQVNVTVEVSAAAPVDVSIMSVEDLDVPMISEQTANETYEFTADSGADLTVDAMSNNDDIFAEDGIYVAVYVNGELVAEDNDGAWAMISTTV